MSKLIELIRANAYIEAIKANLWDHRHNKDYVNLVDEDGMTALMWACINGNIEVVKLLLENGADVNLVEKYSYNALICACFNGYTEIVKLLLEYNADVNMVNKWGMTALMWAEQNESTEIIELLNKHNNYVMLNGKKYKLVEEI